MRERTPKAYVLGALRRAAKEADKRATMFAHHKRNRSSQVAVGLYEISQASAEAALRLWALAAETKRS